jgi:anti-anti-sigma regulatory factor
VTLGVLAGAAGRLPRGSRLALVSRDPRLRRLIDLTDLAGTLALYETIDDAVRCGAPSRANGARRAQRRVD